MSTKHKQPTSLAEWERQFVADLGAAAQGRSWRVEQGLIRCGGPSAPLCPATAVILHKTGRFYATINTARIEEELNLTAGQRRRLVACGDGDLDDLSFSPWLRKAMLEACGLPTGQGKNHAS